MPDTPTPARQAAKVANRVALLQFATSQPDIAGLFEGAGLKPAAGYFPLRIFPMGSVPGAQAASAMPFFPPVLVAKMVERSYGTTPYEEFAPAAKEALSAAAESVFGDVEGVEELAELLGTAADGIEVDGRPIAAAWSSLEWDTPAARMFGAATVLREHRGEGHFMAVRVAGLTGDEMHILANAASGRAPDRVSHGYRSADIEAIGDGLRSRGLLQGWQPTSGGEQLLADIEVATDRLDLAPWRHLGDEGVSRIVELGKDLPRA